MATSNDILGNLANDKLSFWKPQVYEESKESVSLTQYFMCPAGQARALVGDCFNSSSPATCEGMPLTRVSIERHESNKIDLVTLVYSKSVAEDEPDDDDSGEGEDATFDPSESTEIEITTGLSDEPITQHPKYKEALASLDNSVMQDLAALMGGQLEDQNKIPLLNKLKTLPEGLLAKILRGVTHFKSPTMQAKVTLPGKASIPTAGKIASFNGLPELPNGYSWLSGGGGMVLRRGEKCTQITFIAAAWDPDIYS